MIVERHQIVNAFDSGRIYPYSYQQNGSVRIFARHIGDDFFLCLASDTYGDGLPDGVIQASLRGGENE